jgi:transposase
VHLLPGKVGILGVTAKDNRLFVEALLYLYHAGILWHDLPELLGHFRVIHPLHKRWSKRGVWQRVFELLAAGAYSLSAPAASIRARQHSVEAKKRSRPRIY